jgi:hypothetical protein
MIRKNDRYHIMRQHADCASPTLVHTNPNRTKAAQHCWTLNKIANQHNSDTRFFIFDIWTRRPL